MLTKPVDTDQCKFWEFCNLSSMVEDNGHSYLSARTKLGIRLALAWFVIAAILLAPLLGFFAMDMTFGVKRPVPYYSAAIQVASVLMPFFLLGGIPIAIQAFRGRPWKPLLRFCCISWGIAWGIILFILGVIGPLG
ncbi:MAG: hypothetical protein AB3N24_03450 [Leisingera sp.]